MMVDEEEKEEEEEEGMIAESRFGGGGVNEGEKAWWKRGDNAVEYGEKIERERKCEMTKEEEKGKQGEEERKDVSWLL